MNTEMREKVNALVEESETVRKRIKEHIEKEDFGTDVLLEASKILETVKTALMGMLSEIEWLKEKNKALIAGQETLQKALAEKDAEIEALKASENFVSSHSRFNALQNQLNEETKLREELLKTIKENNAEIERLKNDCFCIANERDAIKDCLNTAVEEAIKEFTDRLKAEADSQKIVAIDGKWAISQKIVDGVTKEMVGEG